jgi:hypothetical protein
MFLAKKTQKKQNVRSLGWNIHIQEKKFSYYDIVLRQQN